MLRWKRWSALWQLIGSREVFCFLSFLKRVRNLKTEHWRAVRDGKDLLIAEKLDQLTQTNYLRDAVCIGFILNEAVSILVNAGLMGVKIPEILRSRIDVLRKEEQSK